MVWSKWKATLLVITTCAGVAGVAWSQQQTPSEVAPNLVPVKYVTVHDNGNAVRCLHLETLHMPGNVVIHRVRAVDTGEVYELEETSMVVAQGRAPKSGSISPTAKQPCVVAKPNPRGFLVRLFGKRKSSCCSGQTNGVCSTSCEQCTTVATTDCNSCKPGVVGDCPPYSPPAVAHCPTCPDAPPDAIKPIPMPVVTNAPIEEFGPVAPTPNVSPYAPVRPSFMNPKQKAYPITVHPSPKQKTYTFPTKPKPAPFPVVASQRPAQKRKTTNTPRRTLRDRLQWMFRKRPAKTVVQQKPKVKKPSEPFTTAIAKKGSSSRKHVVLNPSSKTKKKGAVAKSSQGKDKLPTLPFNPNWRKMWGKSSNAKATPPGKSLVETSKLPPASKTANGKVSDPLLDPNRAANENVKKRFGIVANPPMPQGNGQPQQQYVPIAYPPQNPYGGQMPMGVQSVIAAHNGLRGKMTYVPVPVVTVPNPARPPAPPYPKVPKAPQLNKFVNAFTPPPSQGPQGQQPQGPHQGQAMLPNYGPAAAGYPGMANPQYPRMRPNMAPQQAYGRYPVANVNYPRQYPGPRPPQPLTRNWNTPRPVMPAGYAPRPQQAPAGYPQAMPPSVAPQQTVSMAQSQSQPMYKQQQLLEILRNSAYPSQREVAAQNLSRYNWRQYPHVMQAILVAAKEDPSATVRAGCVRCLTKMQADTPEFRQVLAELEKDDDPRIRREVNIARTRLGATAPIGTPGVQRVGGMKN